MSGVAALLAILFASPSGSSAFARDYADIHRSKIDPDNPPPEVREAAADMGYSVHEYKRLYLDRPCICESIKRVYKDCVRRARPNPDISHCKWYMEMKDEYKCDKWEEKYWDPNQDGWFVRRLNKYLDED